MKPLVPAGEGVGCALLTHPRRSPCPGSAGVQRYVTVARRAGQAAAAFAKHLVWSRDCSAHGYLWHGLECSAGLAGHRAVSVRVPVCPWQHGQPGCAERAAWSEAAVILQQGLGTVPVFAIVYQSPSGNHSGTLLPPSSTVSFSTFPTASFGF